MQIADGCAVAINFTLTNDAGEVLDTSYNREPMAYVHGTGNIVPGLEKALTGKQVGDTLKIDVPPEEAYGAHQPTLVHEVPRSALHGVEKIEPGLQFEAESADGPVTATVTEVSDDKVILDGNHPLAGQRLHFEVEITEVREASAEETQHGHVHGAGGHRHTTESDAITESDAVHH